MPTLAEMLRRLAKKAGVTAPGKWLLGSGWNQSLWAEVDGRFPTRHDLDQITTKHPVILREKCGHAAVANSAALARTGLDKTHPSQLEVSWVMILQAS